MLRKKVIQFMCLTLTASMIAGQPLAVFAADTTNIKTEANANSTASKALPMTQLPTLTAGKKYTTEFNMYNVSTLTQDTAGNLFAEESMGVICLASSKADLVANEDGSVRVTVYLRSMAACNAFNYFDNYNDYEKYRNSTEKYLPEIQSLKKGGTVDNQTDGVVYTYEKTTEPYNLEKAITSITFTLPSTSPQIFFTVRAMGMNDGTEEVFGVLGFDYSKLQEVKTDTTDPTTPGGDTTDPTTPGGDTTDPTTPGGNTTDPTTPEEPDPFAHPDSDDETIQSFWKVYDFYYKTLNIEDYYCQLTSATYQNIQYKEVKRWLDATAIRVQTEQLSDADKKILSEEINTYASWISYSVIPKYQGLEAGKTYKVPIKVYKLEESNVTNITGGTYKDFATSGEAEHAKYIKTEATIAVTGNGYAEVTLDLVPDSTDKLKGIVTGGYSNNGMKGQGYLTAFSKTSYTLEELGVTTDKKNPKLPCKTLTIKMYGPLEQIRLFTALCENGATNAKSKESCAIEFDYKQAQEISGTVSTLASSNVKNNLRTYITRAQDVIDGANNTADVKNLYREQTSGKLKETGIVEKAEAVLSKENATEDEMEDMLQEMLDIMELQYPMTYYLRESSLELADLNSDDYTVYSWKIYSDSVQDAVKLAKYTDKDKVADKDTGEAVVEVSGDDINWSKYGTPIYTPGTTMFNGTDLPGYIITQDNETKAAEEALVSVKELKVAISIAKTYTNEDKKYATSSFEALQTAIADAEKLLTATEEVTAEDVQNAISDLKEKESALVELTELKAAISTAKTYTNEDGKYAASSFEALQTAIADAEKLLTATEEVTAEDVQKAIDDLTEKESALTDITELKAAISTAKTYTNEDEKYTKDSFAQLQTAIALGEALVSGKEAANESLVRAAITNIETKSDQLVDISGLKTLIDEAEEKLTQTDVYTEASLKSLENVLNSGSSTAPKVVYNNGKATKDEVAVASENLTAQMEALVEKSTDDLDVNKLADGTYTVAVNLWHATQDKESMGNSALYHTATLTVKDGKYSLRVKGHSMTVSSQTGALDAFRLVLDGSEAKGDGSNYTEIEIKQDGEDYYVDIPLEDTADGNKVSDFYYGGIKVHTVSADGTLGYPMGKNWTPNRLRISWDTLTVLDVENYPAFSSTDTATGITVTAPEGALPAGTKMEVTKVTDAESTSKIDTALTSLASKNTPYKVILYVEDENGNRTTIEPKDNMELTITLPVTNGYDTSKLCVYYIDADGNASEVKGTLDGSTYTIVTGKVGTYAVAEKKTKSISYNITGKPTTTVSGKNAAGTAAGTAATGTATTTTGTTPTLTGKSSAVKTGDESNAAISMFFAAAGASAAALLAVFRRKKER